MKYEKEFEIRNGRKCLVRNATIEDTEEVMRTFNLTHAETENLLTYPEENTMKLEREQVFLRDALENEREVELLAILDGKVVGDAGLTCVRDRIKTRHRADLGLAVEKAYWHMGIGEALMKACIECAGKAGYLQIELDAVAENEKALNLYRKLGFTEFGRNPMGFRKKDGAFQELVMMRKIL